MSEAEIALNGQDGVRRRDFLLVAATAFTAVGAAAALWPFIDQMNPSTDVLAQGGPVDVDLSPLQPGQQILVMWQSKPIFIVRRTPADLKELQTTADTDQLRDPTGEVPQQPPYAENWHRSLVPEYLVLVGICTHLGCIPEYRPKSTAGDLGGDWPGGYFCPCHGSKYDLSGRVFKGVPAPYNLPVPPYNLPTKTTLRIGANPPGTNWDFGNITQI